MFCTMANRENCDQEIVPFLQRCPRFAARHDVKCVEIMVGVSSVVFDACARRVLMRREPCPFGLECGGAASQSRWCDASDFVFGGSALGAEFVGGGID